MHKIWIRSFLIFLCIHGLKLEAQENLIITKEIHYQTITDFSSNKTVINFEDAVHKDGYGEVSVLKIQRKIANSVDSAEITLFNATYNKVYNLPTYSQLKNLPQFSYEITNSAGEKYLTIFALPYSFDRKGKVKAISKMQLMVTLYSSPKNERRIKGNTKWANHSILKSGNWYKIKISNSGIYKITGANMVNFGMNIGNLSVNDVRLFGNGGGMMPEANLGFFYEDLKENAIEIHDENNNGLFESDDYFLFYGQGANIWKYDANLNRFGHSQNLYDDFAYYFLTIKQGNSLRISSLSQNTNTPNKFVTDFIDYKYHDNDSLNLIKTGKQWLGEEFNIILNHSYSFNFPNINTSKQVSIKASVVARSTTASNMNLVANGSTQTLLIPPIAGTYNSAYAAGIKQEYGITTNSSTINITAHYIKSTSVSIGWMDYLEIAAYRHLTMYGSQMAFRNNEVIGNGNISKFTLQNASSNLQIWDITNWTEPKKLDYTLNNNTATFVQVTDSLRQFIAFKGEYKSVTFVEKMKNQDLHATPETDFIICYNDKFKSQAEERADFHRTNDGLKVTTVEQSLLFNEFSSGAKDVVALRNFMKMLYDKALANGGNPPKYLLLFGDGSYDYKDRIQNNTNKIYTFESATSLSPVSSYSSDDFFGILDDNEGNNCAGALDIGIGRFPVNTTAEANLIMDKIKRYTATHNLTNSTTGCSNGTSGISNLADWRNIVCFVADDQNNNIHVSQADYMAKYVQTNYPVYNIDKIYLDAYVQQTTPGGQRYPEATRDLNLRMEKGALVINYTGHGGEIGLAHESLLDINDIQSWTNFENMPLFITATCEFSRYDDPDRISAGEHTLLQPNGGVIALLTTSRLTFSGSNFTLNKIIYQNIFNQINGEFPALGDVIRKSKVAAGSISNNRNFVLLSDPALKLSYPKYDVRTIAINSLPLSQFKDTLGALSKVTVSGQIENQGQILTNFSGFVYPTIFDKKQTFTTLGNDADSSPFEFKLQKNILYKGKVSVTNGQFQFTFIVPKDINYTLGYGRISYYAENGITDANGYNDSLLVGGSSNNNITDNQGPTIIPFMNDTNFVSNGITDENPLFLAFISDENGINTTGNGIGHNIMLTLDNNSAQSIELNAFYQSDVDSYQSGIVKYPLSDLATGPHQINIKVWDILNNSNSANINFIVAHSENTMISEILNYPNPFSDFTNFVFEHNMQCSQMDIKIQIFDNTGRLVRILSTEVKDPGFRIADSELVWHGTSSGGAQLANGIYSYRLVVSTDNNQSTSKNGKIVLLH